MTTISDDSSEHFTTDYDKITAEEELESEQEVANEIEAPKRKRRSNEEILAAEKAARNKAHGQRNRRTQAQIAADNAAEEARRAELAEQRAAHIPTPKPIVFHQMVRVLKNKCWVFGKKYNMGDVIEISEGTREFALAFDAFGNYIFGKTPEEQLAEWGELRYEIVE